MNSDPLALPRNAPAESGVAVPAPFWTAPRLVVVGLLALLAGCAALFALTPSLRGVVGYLAVIAIPGAFFGIALGPRFPSAPRSFPESILSGQLLGLTVFLSVGWALAETGNFTVGNLALGVLAVALPIAMWRRKEINGWTTGDLGRDSSGRWFVLFSLALSIVLVAPILIAQSRGVLIGGDTATFANIAAVLLRLHSWPTLVQANLLSVPPASFTPGITMVYAFLGGAAGIAPIYVTNWVSVAVLFLGALAMASFVERFTDRRTLSYALATMWLLSFPFSSPVITEVLPGYSSDTTLAIPFLLFGMASLVDVVREGPAPRNSLLRSAVTLSSMSVAIALLSQLIWLVWGLALAGAFVVLLRRPFRTATGVVLPPILFALGVFATIFPLGSILASSILTHSSTLRQVGAPAPGLTVQDEVLAFGVGALVISGIGLALWIVGAVRHWGPGFPPRALWAWLVLLTVAVSLLALTPYGALLLGIGLNRFLPYLQIALIPFIVVGLTRLIYQASRHARWKIVARRLPILLIVATLGAGLVVAPSVERIVSPGASFGPEELAAAQWLASNATGTIVADANGGAQSVALVQNFVHVPVVVRDEFALYADIYLTPSPYNMSAFYANAILTDPTAANALAGQAAFNFTDYYLVRAFDAGEIAAFSHLRYFSPVYANSAVVIFMFASSRSAESYFLPATSYSNVTGDTAPLYSSGALNSPVSLPRVENAVECQSSSTGCPGSNLSNTVRATVSYTVTLGALATYTLWIHQDVVGPGTHPVEIFSNGTELGNVSFTAPGWTFGTPFTVGIGVSPFTFTLSFQGEFAAFTPIDYLILTG